MKKIAQTPVNLNDKRIVVYYRCSRNVQKDIRQEQDCRKYCDEHGYTVVQTFREKISGRKRDRQAMTECINYLKSEKIRYLCVSELSRISRSLEGSKILDELTQLSICLIALKEEIKTFRDDFSVDNNQLVLANFALTNAIKESDYLSYRIKSGKRSAVLSGSSWTGGKFLPYGYTSNNGILQIEPTEADIVLKVFTMYRDGWGTIKIANWLNMKCIKTKLNCQWFRPTIVQMFGHRIYIGKRQYDGQDIDTPELRIISDDLFNEVQKLLKERKNTDQTFNQLKKYDFLLDKGLIKCNCGRNYYGLQIKNKPTATYKCTSGKYSKSCGNPSINVKWLDDRIQLELAENWNDLLTDTKQIDAEIQLLSTDLQLLEDQYKNEQQKQNRYNELYAEGRLNRVDYDRKYTECSEQLIRVTQSIEKVKEQIRTNKQIADIGIMEMSEVKITRGFTGKPTNAHEYRQSRRIITTEKLIGATIRKDIIHKVIKDIRVDYSDKKQTIVVNLINGKSFVL
jgi:site-specific DNA recombinase